MVEFKIGYKKTKLCKSTEKKQQEKNRPTTVDTTNVHIWHTMRRLRLCGKRYITTGMIDRQIIDNLLTISNERKVKLKEKQQKSTQI